MPGPAIPDFLNHSPFEAEYLDGPVYRLTGPAEAAQAVRFGQQAGAALISCRTNTDLSMAGFRKIETLVTLETETLLEARAPAGFTVRDATPADIDSCRAIAIAELRQNRFHADPEIDNAAADALRAAWIENAIRGRADRVLVACIGDKVVGFNALLRRNDAIVIDLIAVAGSAQGRGIGGALVASIGQGESVSRIRVGTQAANTASLAFYKRLGFNETDRQDTWHWTPGPSR
ncbi:MAG: GNAT family N-acetyltransferase [Alphaproteobacteria bacterium]